jgi:single-stranded DNA-binding protein
MYDLNDCRFTGTVQQIRPIQTQSGIPMVQFRIQCWRETIRCVAFKELANQIVEYYQTGDRIELRGRIQSSNWEQDGAKVYSYQVNVSALDTGQPSRAPMLNQERDERPGVKDCNGGPF